MAQAEMMTDRFHAVAATAAGGKDGCVAIGICLGGMVERIRGDMMSRRWNVVC